MNDSWLLIAAVCCFVSAVACFGLAARHRKPTTVHKAQWEEVGDTATITRYIAPGERLKLKVNGTTYAAWAAPYKHVTMTLTVENSKIGEVYEYQMQED